MKAEIIAVGSELLLGQVINSNAAYLSQQLSKIGIDVFYHVTVGDNPERMKSTFDQACRRSDVVICTGGLGPTADDITNETWGEFFKLEEFEDPEQVKIIKEKYKGRKNFPQINLKQARRPKGTRVIPNQIGTAPGIIHCTNYPEGSDHEVSVMTFPGVPCEMQEMYESQGEPYLLNKIKERGDEAAIVSRDVRLVNITESEMAQRVQELFHTSNPSLAPYATLGECRLRITAKAETVHKASNLIQPLQMQIEKEFHDHIYGYDGDTLPGVIAQKLIENNLTISFAESCTGGLLSKMITDIPGASNYTLANFVTYSNEAKTKLLKVSKDILDKHGAVSPQTAKAMAEGLNEISGADINVSITGIAGPDGYSPEKPIGTIYVGVVFPKTFGQNLKPEQFQELEISDFGEKKVFVCKLNWSARPLDRMQVRELASKRTLDIVRKILN